MECPLSGPLPPLTPDAADRIQTLIAQPITLMGQTEKRALITTTVREIILKLKEVMPKGTQVSLFGSSVQYLVDGDYRYSKECLTEEQVGGYRPIPQDFDISLYSPEATYRKRWEVLNHLVLWASGRKVLDRVEQKKYQILLVDSPWNCNNPSATNRFLYFSVKDEKDRRYEFRLTEALGLPYLFSIERIQLIFNENVTKGELKPNDASGLECIRHWNQGVAIAERIELMDPLAWVKLASKMSRGILFRAADIQGITSRAMDRSLWSARNIPDLEQLIRKGIDPMRVRKSLHYLFHAYRLLPEGEEHPVLDEPKVPGGEGAREKLLSWIARHFFRGKREFNESLNQLSSTISLATLIYPEGYQGITFKRVTESEIRVRMGEKRSDLCLFVPWSNPFERFYESKDLGAIFSLYPSDITRELKRTWQEDEIKQTSDPKKIMALFNEARWPKDTIPLWFYQKLMDLNVGDELLGDHYSRFRKADLRGNFLEKLKSLPFNMQVFYDIHGAFYPEELKYFKAKFTTETAVRILTRIQEARQLEDFILNYLKPDMSTEDNYLRALYVKKSEELKFKHFPVYLDATADLTHSYTKCDLPEIMEVYYKVELSLAAFKTPDEELCYLAGLIRLFPKLPDWLLNTVIDFIDKDCEKEELYFLHWSRAIPQLVGHIQEHRRACLLPEKNFNRFQSTVARLMRESKVRHLTHLFSILANLDKCCFIGVYHQNIYSDMIRKSKVKNTYEPYLRYLHEASLDALLNYFRNDCIPQALNDHWEALQDRVSGCLLTQTYPSLFEYAGLQLKFLNICFYYRSKQAKERFLDEFIKSFMGYYTKLDTLSFQILYSSLLMVMKESKIYESQYKDSLTTLKKYMDSLNKPCSII